MKRVFVCLVISCLAAINVRAQSSNAWQGKGCAVVLTYDDALNVHLDNVIPALDSLGLKGTFYLSGYAPGCKNRIADWKKAAIKGHELANHTLFHPCTGRRPGREWVQPDYDLSTYTVQRMQDELRMTNVLLTSIDGKTRRTFAYPCGDTRIGDSLYLDKNDFVAARTVQRDIFPINKVDLYNVGCYAVEGQSGDELIAQVKSAMANHTLLVFLFHGVGGEHNINVSLPAHRQLLYFLKQNEKDIWIAPMLEVAEYIGKYQASVK